MRFILFVLGGLLAVGCATKPDWSRPSTEEDLFQGGPSDPDECDGLCVLAAPAPFERTVLLRIGPPGELPPCPEAAPVSGFLGCEQCASSPEAGSGEPLHGGRRGPVAGGAPQGALAVSECVVGPPVSSGCELHEVCLPFPGEGTLACVFVMGDHPGLPCPDSFPQRTVASPAPAGPTGEPECACAPGRSTAPPTADSAAIAGRDGAAEVVTFCCRPEPLPPG
ncbi:MAG: hypothetical protein R3B70_18720 [Polyangiaceae bacterium]